MNAPPSPTLQRLAHIERLVDAIDLPMARWDPLARLVFCNAPYLHWTGRSREELLGCTLQELFGDEAWQIAQPAFAQAFEPTDRRRSKDPWPVHRAALERVLLGT